MRRKSYFPKIFLLICIVILVLFSLALGREFVKKRQIDKEIYSLEQEIERLEEDQSEFSELIDYLNTEDFLEKEARLKLGLQKPGETLVVISDDSFETDEGSKKNLDFYEEYEVKQNNLTKWWNYFFNL